jgi:hypothetical protein
LAVSSRKRENPGGGHGVGLRRLGLVQELVMKLRSLVAAAALVFASNASVAGPINWQRYVVAETGASVDIPTSIFTEDAGKPEAAYSKQFLTSDRRGNLTIESLENEAGDSPAVFSRQEKSAERHRLQEDHIAFFRRVELP